MISLMLNMPQNPQLSSLIEGQLLCEHSQWFYKSQSKSIFLKNKIEKLSHTKALIILKLADRSNREL